MKPLMDLQDHETRPGAGLLDKGATDVLSIVVSVMGGLMRLRT